MAGMQNRRQTHQETPDSTMFLFKKQRPQSTFSQRPPADGSPAALQLVLQQQKKKRPEMLCEEQDGCRCSEESHVELRRELKETKRELQRLKSRKEKPVSPSDTETLGTKKMVGPLTVWRCSRLDLRPSCSTLHIVEATNGVTQRS